MEEAQKQFYDAFEAVKFKPDQSTTADWDPAMIVIDALRHLDPDPSAAQVRDYIAQLRVLPASTASMILRKLHSVDWA